MGRAMTMLVGAVILGASYLILTEQQTTLKAREYQSDHQFKGIASNVARSGFQRGVSAIKRDLMAAPQTFERVTMGDGYYDLQITTDIYGDLAVSVNAHSGDAEYDMGGTVLFTAPFPAAVMLEDDGIAMSGSGFYQISGVDQRMPSRGAGGGFQEPVRGIMTTESHVTAIAGALMENRIVGIGSEPDTPVNPGSVVGGLSKADMEALYQEALLAAHSVLSADPNGDIPAGQLSAAVSGSSPGSPKIIRARGNLTVTESIQGYGMLIVEDGDLNVISSDFDWEGLIMLRKQAKDTLSLSLLNTTLHGALVAYDLDGGSTGIVECVPDFEIIGDEAVVQDSFKVKIEVLGAAISASGEYDMPVTARVNIGAQSFEPWGSYDLALDGNVNTGNSGVTYSWEPDTVFPPGSSISIDGRSWEKREGENGDQNNEWQVSMEEQSSSSGQQIYLLEDGSSVPSVGGFMGQYSVVEFLSEYIANDALVLEANEAVSLFELGSTDTESEAFDLQDLVVLVSLVDGGASSCYAEGAPSMLDVAFRDGTAIHYSSEAIAKLGLHLSTIRNSIGVRVAKSAMHGRGRNETLVFQSGLLADDQEGADAEVPAGEATVSLCHNGNDKTVPHQTLGAHIAHGDYLGACVAGE